MTIYNSYHTNLILLHHIGSLSIDLKSTIPRSTLSNWKRKDISRIIGCDCLSVNDVSVLKESFSKHSIRSDSTLITDGGPENQGEVSKFTAGNHNINQLIAQKDIIQSNSMVESVNKHIKYYYLFKNELKDFNDTFKYLSMSVPDYNNKPHGRLYGLTPNEVLNGNDPAKDNYQNDIAKARKKRLLQNHSIE